MVTRRNFFKKIGLLSAIGLVKPKDLIAAFEKEPYFKVLTGDDSISDELRKFFKFKVVQLLPPYKIPQIPMYKLHRTALLMGPRLNIPVDKRFVNKYLIPLMHGLKNDMETKIKEGNYKIIPLIVWAQTISIVNLNKYYRLDYFLS